MNDILFIPPKMKKSKLFVGLIFVDQHPLSFLSNGWEPSVSQILIHICSNGEVYFITEVKPLNKLLLQVRKI